MKISYRIHTGFDGVSHGGSCEIPDDTSKEEIHEIIEAVTQKYIKVEYEIDKEQINTIIKLVRR